MFVRDQISTGDATIIWPYVGGGGRSWVSADWPMWSHRPVAVAERSCTTVPPRPACYWCEEWLPDCCGSPRPAKNPRRKVDKKKNKKTHLYDIISYTSLFGFTDQSCAFYPRSFQGFFSSLFVVHVRFPS